MKLFFNVVFFPHLLFYLLCLHDMARKAQCGRHFWPQIREMEEGREKDWVSSTAGFRRNKKEGIEWVIAVLRREEGKLGL